MSKRVSELRKLSLLLLSVAVFPAANRAAGFRNDSSKLGIVHKPSQQFSHVPVRRHAAVQVTGRAITAGGGDWRRRTCRDRPRDARYTDIGKKYCGINNDGIMYLLFATMYREQRNDERERKKRKKECRAKNTKYVYIYYTQYGTMLCHRLMKYCGISSGDTDTVYNLLGFMYTFLQLTY